MKIQPSLLTLITVLWLTVSAKAQTAAAWTFPGTTAATTTGANITAGNTGLGSDIVSLGFLSTPKLAALIENTRKVSTIDVAAYDAIVVAGGQGPMFTFEKATDLHRKFVEFYEAGKIACALCHGVAVLRYARLSNGQYLAKGKAVTGFANVEEDYADNAVWEMNLLSRDKHVMPWRIEDELKKLGANYVQAGLWRGFAIRDGNLVTGQQNFSPLETADVLVRAIGE